MERLKPIPPLPEDCCGQGCCPCVNDIYEAELKLWEKSIANDTLNRGANDTGVEESISQKDVIFCEYIFCCKGKPMFKYLLISNIR